MFRTLITPLRAFLLATALMLPTAAADALMLDVWNLSELNDSDNFVDVQIGASNGSTTLTVRWVGGVDDTPGGIGIDKFLINNSDPSIEVVSVFENSIAAANDVTSEWWGADGDPLGMGPDGFRLFVEKLFDPFGDGGIDPDSLIFVLDDLYAEDSFVDNWAGSSFAAHVRYAGSCNGWVSNAGRGGMRSDADCAGIGPGTNTTDGRGGGSDAIPEPGAALVFAAGLGVLSASRRWRRR